MSNKNAPTVANTAASAGDATINFKASHNGHPLTHLGMVANPSLPNSAGVFPATFDAWYCQKDNVVFLDNAS